jgi:acyl-CoA thioester hydrolase
MTTAPIPVFRRTRRIESGDIDELGHVNNVVWVRFIVDLAVAHSTAVGLDGTATRACGGIWVVRRHEVIYHRSAAPGDEICEETWVASMRGARSHRRARFRDADGRLLVESVTEWAFVDPESQRPRRIPRAISDHFERVTDPP